MARQKGLYQAIKDECERRGLVIHHEYNPGRGKLGDGSQSFFINNGKGHKVGHVLDTDKKKPIDITSVFHQWFRPESKSVLEYREEINDLLDNANEMIDKYFSAGYEAEFNPGFGPGPCVNDITLSVYANGKVLSKSQIPSLVDLLTKL